MASFNAPRKGSMAFYPRVRAKKETPTMKAKGEEAKPLSFLCYKVGMVQVLGKDEHQGSTTFGQDISKPATIVECPSLKVLGIRAYKKDDIGYTVYGDIITDDFEKELGRKINNFKKKSQKNKDKKEDKLTAEKLEKDLDKVEYFTLLTYTQPKSIKLKKKPDVTEINIGGKKEEQFAYAKEMIGKEINIEDVFEEGNYLDAKGVTKGKGFQGVIKRFNVKIQRPKAKTRRIIGSISPWNPSTVMFTVGRPGQMGYHNRTEYNKKLLKISDNIEELGKNGYPSYGNVKGKFAVIIGSLPGPAKRCISIRKSIRPERKRKSILNQADKILVK